MVLKEISATPEVLVDPPKPTGELDPSRYSPDSDQLDFLRKTVAPDDEDIKKRVLDVQQKSYSAYPYPCIHAFQFIALMMAYNDIYPKIIEAGKKGDTILLDLGCCMGTDLRKAALDGYPASNLIGCDLRQDYIDSGHLLFNDASTCEISFLTFDIFKLSTTPQFDNPSLTPLKDVKSLEELKGRLTHIYTGLLFHLFDEESQYAMAYRLVLLLKVAPGAVIFGRHQAATVPGILDSDMGSVRYGHSPESWKEMWKKVFSEIIGEEFAEKSVRVESMLHPIQVKGYAAPGQAEPGWTAFLYWNVSII